MGSTRTRRTAGLSLLALGLVTAGHPVAIAHENHGAGAHEDSDGDEDERWSWQKKAGYGGLALSLVAVGFGIGWNVEYHSRVHDFDDLGCTTQALQIDPCEESAEDIDRAKLWSLLGYVSALVTASMGTYFLITAPDGPLADAKPAAPNARVSWSCQPGATTGANLSIACLARF